MGENESLIIPSQVLQQQVKEDPVKPQQIGYENFTSLMLQTAPFVEQLPLTTLLKSIGAYQKTFSPLCRSIDLFIPT